MCIKMAGHGQQCTIMYELVSRSVYGHIIGTLHSMCNAGVVTIAVKTIISTCDIIFYHLVYYLEDQIFYKLQLIRVCSLCMQ